MGRLLDLFTNKYPYTDFHELNLSALIEIVTELIKNVESLDEWKVQHESEYEELKKMYDDILSGNFPPSMYNKLHKWVVLNTESIIGAAVKMAFFDLTSDGHLIVYIPESWDDITFNTTGLDIFPVDVSFGHLTITY